MEVVAVTDVMSKVGAFGTASFGSLAGLPPAVTVVLIALVLVVGAVMGWLEAREQTRRTRVDWEGAIGVYRVHGDGAAVARALHRAEPAAVEDKAIPAQADVPAAAGSGISSLRWFRRLAQRSAMRWSGPRGPR